MFNNDTFMTVIRTTDSIGELESVIDLLDCDVAKWRAKDTGGDNGKSYRILSPMSLCPWGGGHKFYMGLYRENLANLPVPTY